MIRAKAILLLQPSHLIPTQPSIGFILLIIKCTLSSQSLQSLRSFSIFAIRQSSSGSLNLIRHFLAFNSKDTFTPAESMRPKRPRRPTLYSRYSSSPSWP